MNNRQSALSIPGFVCLLLALATLAVYFPAHHFGFVDYDDPGYFSENPRVLAGLTWPNIHWAFVTGAEVNWHPLTWLSLMLDATIFGDGAGGPHVTNVLLHAANSILLFLLFLRMSGATWRCAVLAMFFAIHPLHVESVAWISERKDVLCAFFGLLTLLCYVRYVELADKRAVAGATDLKETAPNSGFRSPLWFYFLALFLFACGLMSKPMLVTLPCVLFLLDFWPLRRFRASMLARLIFEKIPFFLLTAAASFVTFLVQRNGMAVVPLSVIPLDARIENAFVSYARYLGKIFCPVKLAAIYPYPGYWPAGVVIFAVVLFIVISIAAVALRKKFPWILTGWFWFAGMLVPVIGLVQVGGQAMADRYAYLPMIGVLIVVVWGAAEICLACRARRTAIVCVSLILFGACAWRARSQVQTWKNDETLFGHTLAVTRDNYLAELDLGYWYSKTGKVKQALEYYNRARKIAPDDPTALYNVGNAFARLGDWAEAIRSYQRALRFVPNQPDVLNNLGMALAHDKQIPQALSCFRAVLKKRPDFADAQNNLGSILFMQGHYPEAALAFYAAVQDDPYQAPFAVNLGDTLVRLGKKAAAAECYQQALQLEPADQIAQARLKALGAVSDENETNKP